MPHEAILEPFGAAAPVAREAPQAAQSGRLARLRRALAFWLYPPYGDLIESAEAKVQVVESYQYWLAECERQRRIDEDARHLWQATAQAERLRYEKLKGEIEGAEMAIAEAEQFRAALR